jgi:hypothetical protein
VEGDKRIISYNKRSLGVEVNHSMRLRTNLVNSNYLKTLRRSRENVLGLERFPDVEVPYGGMIRHQVLLREIISNQISKTIRKE